MGMKAKIATTVSVRLVQVWICSMFSKLLPANAPAHTIVPYQIPEAVSSGSITNRGLWRDTPAKIGTTALKPGRNLV